MESAGWWREVKDKKSTKLRESNMSVLQKNYNKKIKKLDPTKKTRQTQAVRHADKPVAGSGGEGGGVPGSAGGVCQGSVSAVGADRAWAPLSDAPFHLL